MPQSQGLDFIFIVPAAGNNQPAERERVLQGVTAFFATGQGGCHFENGALRQSGWGSLVREDLHDGSRGHGRVELGCHLVEQGFREILQPIVQFAGNARGEECNALQQTLHVGVGAFIAAELKAPGNFRELGGKPPGGVAQVVQFVLVEFQEGVVHGAGVGLRG